MESVEEGHSVILDIFGLLSGVLMGILRSWGLEQPSTGATFVTTYKDGHRELLRAVLMLEDIGALAGGGSEEDA